MIMEVLCLLIHAIDLGTQALLRKKGSTSPELNLMHLSSFLGISDDLGEPIWNSILEKYFDTADKAELSAINDKIRLMSAIRFLYLLAVTDLKNGDLGERRIKRTQDHISELLKKVNGFEI